jgi:hypothetical protein
MLGREVAMLVNERKPAGSYEIHFSAAGVSAFGGDAAKLPSGMYFCRLTTGNTTLTKKMMVVR